MRTAFTEYRALHGASGPLAEALTALPGYLEASAAYDKAKTQLEDYLRGLQVPGDAAAVDRVLGLLDAGKPLPASLPLDVWQTLHGRDANVALDSVFSQALQALSGRRDGVIDAGRDQVMRYLDEQVRSCVDEARALDLKGATSAEDAIDAGVGEAWGRMRALRERYRAIRQGQTTMVRTAYSSEVGYDDPWSFIANLADLVPRWHDIKRGRTTVMQDDHAEVIDGGTWPWLPQRGMLDDDQAADDHELRFTWLLEQPRAQPWVPTPAQLRETAGRASDALNAQRPKPDPRPEVQVRRAMREAQSQHAAELTRTPSLGGRQPL